MKNEILNIPNESTIDTNFEVQTENTELQNEISSLNAVSEQLNDSENELNNDIDTTTNCLALTVRENYHIVVVKNFFRKSFRVSWKVALSMLTINFLNMFL